MPPVDRRDALRPALVAAAIRDEAGYVRAGAEAAETLRGHGSLAAWGRIFAHNPGHAIAFVPTALLPGGPAPYVRVLQGGALLFAGLLLQGTVARVRGRQAAVVAALALWLTLPYYVAALWPVAFGTLAVAALLGAWVRLLDSPAHRPAQDQLGAVLALAPLVYPAALAMVPLFVLDAGRRGGRAALWRVGLPVVTVVLPLSIGLSAVAGRPVLLEFTTREALAMGNNPFVAEGRGSVLGDPERVERVRWEVERHCGDRASIERFRCELAGYGALGMRTIGEDPAAFLRRATRRVREAWAPDTFPARHLMDARAFEPERTAPFLLLARAWPAVMDFGLAAGLLVALPGLLRDRRGRTVLFAVALATLPIAIFVGLPRLRLPLTPLLLFLVAIGTAPRRTRGQPAQ